MDILSSDLYIEPFKEMVAYEALWSKVEKPTFKNISERLQHRLPSTFFNILAEDLQEVSEALKAYDLSKINALIVGTQSYPEELHRLEHFLPIIYFKGDLDLFNHPSVSIVGSRKASSKGLQIASEIAKNLVKNDYAIISGLAKGIDTAAHKAAIQNKGKTIAVIGTPLHESYPRENADLQKLIEEKYLLVSQVPFIRYAINKKRNWSVNKFFFPERNKTMAALSKATIIIEASDTSGTLTQARECLRIGKKLIIHSHILENKDLTWPSSYLKRENTYLAETAEDILDIIKDEN